MRITRAIIHITLAIFCFVVSSGSSLGGFGDWVGGFLAIGWVGFWRLGGWVFGDWVGGFLAIGWVGFWRLGGWVFGG